MRDQYVFDIPVYRKSNSEFDLETEIGVKQEVEWIVSHDPQRRPLSHETRERIMDRTIARAGGPWQFNQVVGWLRLFVEGSTIGGHLWWVDAKRLNRRMRNRRLRLLTFSDIFHQYFPTEPSNIIFSRIVQRLGEMACEPPYDRCYLDLDVFLRVGPFVDWRALMGACVVGASKVRNKSGNSYE